MQLALALHSTHILVDLSHTGVSPPQSLKLDRHSMQDPSWQNSLAGQSACRISIKNVCKNKSTLTLVRPALYAGSVWDVTIKESWVLAVGVGLAFNTYIG